MNLTSRRPLLARAALALAALALLAGTAAAQAPSKKAPPAAKGKRSAVVDRVVAVVNETVVLESELRTRITPVVGDVQGIPDARERKRRFEKLRTQMLDEMVNEELIVQAAENAKIEVESTEVQAALDEIKTSNNLDDAALAQVLAAQGYTLANYKQDLRRQLLRLRAVNQLVAPKVDPNVRRGPSTNGSAALPPWLTTPVWMPNRPDHIAVRDGRHGASVT